jgi:choline transport protein
MSAEEKATADRTLAAGRAVDLPNEQPEEELINASGHVQELQRNFSLVSLAGIGITVGNVWPAAGGSILVALYNGGSPGMFT